MKIALALSLLVFAQAAYSQAPAPAPVTLMIGSQGTDVIKRTVGAVPKNSTLVRMDVCSQGSATNVSAGQIGYAIAATEGYELYSSDVVNTVLSVLQNQDSFTRIQKAIAAGKNAVLVAAAILKLLSPQAALIITVAPDILSAILPAVGSPRDVVDLGKSLLIDDSTLSLGAIGDGANCKTIKAVAMTTAVKIDKVTVQ
jgi:hypothetical protein